MVRRELVCAVVQLTLGGWMLRGNQHQPQASILAADSKLDRSSDSMSKPVGSSLR
jgi:hypothetical protein